MNIQNENNKRQNYNNYNFFNIQITNNKIKDVNNKDNNKNKLSLSRGRYVSRKNQNDNKEEIKGTNNNRNLTLKFEKIIVRESRRNTYKRPDDKEKKKDERKTYVCDKNERKIIIKNDDLFKNSIRNKYKRKKFD